MWPRALGRLVRAALHVERTGRGGEPDGARSASWLVSSASPPRPRTTQAAFHRAHGRRGSRCSGPIPATGVVRWAASPTRNGPGAVGGGDLGGQREPLDVEHLDGQVGQPGGGAQRSGSSRRGLRAGCVEQADVGPAAGARRAQRPGVRLVDESEQAGRLRQRRAGPEQHLDGVPSVPRCVVAMPSAARTVLRVPSAPTTNRATRGQPSSCPDWWSSCPAWNRGRHGPSGPTVSAASGYGTGSRRPRAARRRRGPARRSCGQMPAEAPG